MTDDERFLGRWSRRKTADRPETAEQMPPVPDAPAPNAQPLQDAPDAPPEIDPATLPDIDNLDKESDFSVFMQNGVPEALRNRALRKLWQVDPAFSVVDGLLEYGEDYTDIAGIAEAVQSIYKVGKGMVDETDDADEAAEDIADSDEPSDDPGRTTAGQQDALDEPHEEEVMALDAADENPQQDDNAVSAEKNTKA